jgi:uncharacterized membrane protein YdjX (TVP38/TMEM64 family)
MQIAPDTTGQRIARGPVIVAGAILVAIMLALVWRFTPLADIITPLSMIGWAQSLAGYWWAPIALVIAYTPASLVMFPRWLITLAAVATFGPWMAFAYAQTGVLIAALCGYVAGELVDRDTVRRMAGPRINRLSKILQRRGFFAVTLVRLVPIAPFMVINVVMGAMRIRLRHFMIGTVLGMLPGMLATTVLGEQITAAIVKPFGANVWLVAGAVLVLALFAYGGHRWLRHADVAGRERHDAGRG